MAEKRSYKQREANAQRASRTEMLYADPPPYSSQPTSEQASLSNVDTAASSVSAESAPNKLDFSPSALELPTPTECITHLKLLHAFARLRHKVGNMDSLFGIEMELEKFEDAKETIDSQADAGARNVSQQPEGVHGETSKAKSTPIEEEKKAATLAERVREKRWTTFVTKAVQRFEHWWDTLPATSGHFPLAIRLSDFDAAIVSRSPLNFPYKGDGMRDKMNTVLPPLDVLMVWHSYMLNPRNYLEDCMRRNKHQVWQTPFPWEAIHEAINHETFAYHPGDIAIKEWNTKTKLPWDSLADPQDPGKMIACPKCSTRLAVPWTVPPYTPGLDALESYLSNDIGFAGENFRHVCLSCELVVTHEKLRIGKFIQDVSDVWSAGLPLPGTILNAQGIPELTGKGKHVGTHDPFFPNRVVLTTAECSPDSLRQKVNQLSVAQLRDMFQRKMASPSQLKLINAEQHKTDFVAKESKIAVRKVLSHYWDNSSSFGLDLVGAVIRQGSFIQKMTKIDWLHSPAGMTTMQRLIVKYHRFVRIIGENPKKIAVPTLDVDLAWHTHQLTPKIYFRYTMAETKKFLNHDDKISESSLHTMFQWTSTTYEKKYGQPYSECACWYCECTREPLRSSFTNRINPLRSSKQYDVDKLAEKALPKDAVNGIHISAHNAVMMNNDRSTYLRMDSWAQQRRREFEDLDLQYAKVCKRYQKKKKADETPSRENDAYVYGAYGYPMYYPVYVPYYAEPTCEGDRYTTVNGGGGGACGGCAAGTCAGSASLGSCAGGAGTPSCKASCGGHGDASGGCGSCGGGGDGGGGCGGCGGGFPPLPLLLNVDNTLSTMSSDSGGNPRLRPPADPPSEREVFASRLERDTKFLDEQIERARQGKGTKHLPPWDTDDWAKLFEYDELFAQYTDLQGRAIDFYHEVRRKPDPVVEPKPKPRRPPNYLFIELGLEDPQPPEQEQAAPATRKKFKGPIEQFLESQGTYLDDMNEGVGSLSLDDSAPADETPTTFMPPPKRRIPKSARPPYCTKSSVPHHRIPRSRYRLCSWWLPTESRQQHLSQSRSELSGGGPSRKDNAVDPSKPLQAGSKPQSRPQRKFTDADLPRFLKVFSQWTNAAEAPERITIDVHDFSVTVEKLDPELYGGMDGVVDLGLCKDHFTPGRKCHFSETACPFRHWGIELREEEWVDEEWWAEVERDWRDNGKRPFMPIDSQYSTYRGRRRQYLDGTWCDIGPWAAAYR
ncbi:hypothetical protein BDV96DRAFT_653799 [Lophiotrema nucula]|uniref:Uncharacterized protein n=1 Tax=Lophiotrema nucula TaxID=690887 RepID=A0A6A5YMA7_9PLEO|nr:hypothetical protein BDV96DRAFT_653799 [Lophiotrema nucula]